MRQRTIVILKIVVWVLALVPLALLIFGATTNSLGADPLANIEHTTGRWVLRLLLVTLAVTPLRRITGWNWLVRFRRMLGLFAFFYACLHLTAYLWFDQNFVWTNVAHDIPKRPFILIGFTAWLLLIPLTATSTAAAIRKLGGKRWNILHRSIYVVAVLGVVHFWWAQKADHSDPLEYAVVLGVLLASRLLLRTHKRRTAAAGSAMIERS